MFGLSFGKNVFLGADIGTSAIKIIEIKISGGRPVLSNYAWMSFEDVLHEENKSTNDADDALAGYLKAMAKEARFKTKNIHASIPAFGGLVTLIDFPAMAKDDLEQAIRFEAHKYIPTSLDEVVMSWDVLGEAKGPTLAERTEKLLDDGSNQNQAPSAEKIQVLLVAASRNKVERCEKIIQNAGFRLQSIEIESFAMARSLVGNDKGNFVIIDMGSRICNIILLEKGIIRANRNIDAGGRDLTRTIAKSLQISEERAEKMKMTGKSFFVPDSNINFPTLELIAEETKRMISSTLVNQAAGKVDSVILSGGTADLAGIDTFFQKMLGIKTIIGNPMSRVEYNKKLEPVIKKLGVRLSVAVGLALKGVDEYLDKHKK